MAEDTESSLLTFKEAQVYLRISRSTLYRLMWTGQLQGHKVGIRWKFYQSDLDKVIRPMSLEPRLHATTF